MRQLFTPGTMPVPMSPATGAPSQMGNAMVPVHMIPPNPSPAELGMTIEHMTGRPAEVSEVRQVLSDLQVTYGDYAPGGMSASGYGVDPTRVR